MSEDAADEHVSLEELCDIERMISFCQNPPKDREHLIRGAQSKVSMTYGPRLCREIRRLRTLLGLPIELTPEPPEVLIP